MNHELPLGNLPVNFDSLYELSKSLDGRDTLNGIKIAVNAFREAWLGSLLESERRYVSIVSEKIGNEVPEGNLELFKDKFPSVDLENIVNTWTNPTFHSSLRFHLPQQESLDRAKRNPRLARRLEILQMLYHSQGIEFDESMLEEIIRTRDISILPTTITLSNAVMYNLPVSPEKHSEDSFGIKLRKHVVTEVIDGKEYYLATRKTDYATFLVVFGKGESVYCEIGCKDCYRGRETRELQPFLIREQDGTFSRAYFFSPEEQIQRLVELSNTDDRYNGVYDILLSGGEPLKHNNQTIRNILESVKKAKYLTSFRICTGALFLGLASRFFDGELAEMLSSYRDDTGNSVSITAHLPHIEMLTPEAIYAARILNRNGIEIQTQTPLIAGINVFPDSVEKSYECLSNLMRAIKIVTNSRPYKWLHDTENSFPIELGARLFEFWRRHRGESDITRPTSFAKFHPEGNVDLSLPILKSCEKRFEGDEIVYRIPQGERFYEIREKIF